MQIQQLIRSLFPYKQVTDNSLIIKHLSVSSKKLNSRRKIYEWISQGIELFQEWYQPVDFGNGVIAHVTLPPKWNTHAELDHDIDRGLAKWNYIVKKHLPSLAGKRILDLGCSSGLYSLELAKMGAKEVIGVDRDNTISHYSTDTPPPQDVIAQARFVKKAFELLQKKKYSISYIAHDIGRIQQLKLGRFDFILALCVVYHELERMPHLISQLSAMSDTLILQANPTHGGKLGQWSSVEKHVELLLKNGFTQIEIDAPQAYSLPVIVARKQPAATGNKK